MTLREQLLAALAAYQAGLNLQETTVSRRLFDNSKKVGELRSVEKPGDVNTATFERVMQEMSDRWPEGATWPANVKRPPSRRRPT